MLRTPDNPWSGPAIKLAASRNNRLVEKVLNEFCPRFTPGGEPVYVSDTYKKGAYFDAKYLENLNIVIQDHAKLPEVIVNFTKKNWVVLVVAGSSSGPINPNRLTELRALFASKRTSLVFVTAVYNCRSLSKYLGQIAWNTHAWIADNPDHMIHFGGSPLLGPQ